MSNRIIILFLVILLSQFFNYYLSKYWIIKTNIFESFTAGDANPLYSDINKTTTELGNSNKELNSINDKNEEQNIKKKAIMDDNIKNTKILNNLLIELKNTKTSLAQIYPDQSSNNATQISTLNTANARATNNQIINNNSHIIIQICSALISIANEWYNTFNTYMTKTSDSAKNGKVIEEDYRIVDGAHSIISVIYTHIPELYNILKDYGIQDPATAGNSKKIIKWYDDSKNRIGDTKDYRYLATQLSVRRNPSSLNFDRDQNNEYPYITYFYFSSNFGGNISLYNKGILFKTADIATLQYTNDVYKITISKENNLSYICDITRIPIRNIKFK